LESSNKILQFLGIPFTALLSVLFGLLLISFPMGLYVIFETEIGGDINYEYPLTHLDIFAGTELHQSFVDVSIGDAFVVLWVFYLVIFVIATLGPKSGFLKTLSPVISFGKCDTRLNYMIGVTQWFSILILISALINFVQEGFGVEIIPPPTDNDLIQFFYVSLAPLVEEFVFRLILIGIPLFALYASKSSVRHFIGCLWNPASLNIYNTKKAVFLIVFVGVLFGFAHVAFEDSWSGGKFAQAAASGIILGWVYLRYGFVTSLLIHWATNYFVFSYVGFLSQINSISIQDAFSHSLMSSLEILFLVSGVFSVCIFLAQRFLSTKEKTLNIYS
jgi:hypothetical protein